jgi:two-component system, OmpR family, phosphate regulon sensor histidine kinase PhoR
MMKTMSGHLFFTFILIVGSILAVLGLVLGQLFPFFAKEYNERQTVLMEQQIEQSMDRMNMSTSEREEIMQALVIGEQRSKDMMREEMKRLMLVIAILLICAYVIIWTSTSNILRNFLEPIINVTNTAKELAVGNYRARAYANGPQSMVELKNSINKLANNLETITKTRLVEEERLKTLVETMGSGLIMMNREGQIIIANRHFLKNYEMTYEDIVGKSFLNLQLPEPLKKFIDHVFFTEQPERKQMTIQRGTETTHKQVFGAPVIGEHGKWLGVVIVLHDITELLRLEQVRRDFVANVSHELRTPITSIKGFSETLLDGAFKDETMLLSFLEIIYKESNRLQILVNDLLDLSKLERQGYEIEKEDVSVQDVLVRVIDVASQKMDEKNIQVTVNLETDLHVLGEVNRLIQIFTNLINNAIMYSPEESALTINAYEQNQFGVVEVIDEGIGIEKADLARVFERFYRVDTARSRNSGGTGLGLAIVKHLVELHHGKIEVESELGQGTTMRVKIPLNRKS